MASSPSCSRVNVPDVSTATYPAALRVPVKALPLKHASPGRGDTERRASGAADKVSEAQADTGSRRLYAMVSAAAWLGLPLPRPDVASALYAALRGWASLCSPDAHTPILLPPVPTIRQDEEVRRDGEAKGLGGLEVDDQLEVHGLLDWQIDRLGAFQDSVHVVGATLERICELARRP